MAGGSSSSTTGSLGTARPVTWSGRPMPPRTYGGRVWVPFPAGPLPTEFGPLAWNVVRWLPRVKFALGFAAIPQTGGSPNFRGPLQWNVVRRRHAVKFGLGFAGSGSPGVAASGTGAILCARVTPIPASRSSGRLWLPRGPSSSPPPRMPAGLLVRPLPPSLRLWGHCGRACGSPQVSFVRPLQIHPALSPVRRRSDAGAHHRAVLLVGRIIQPPLRVLSSVVPVRRPASDRARAIANPKIGRTFGTAPPVVRLGQAALVRRAGPGQLRHGAMVYPRLLFSVPAPRTLGLPRMVRRFGEDRLRQRRGIAFAQTAASEPVVLDVSYHIYSNTGGGDPINYITPVGTTAGLTWTLGPLSYPGDWKFGVRAFDSYGEEQNLDCAVDIILDATGKDITDRPLSPIALRVFPMANAAIRAEWAYPTGIQPNKAPLGFHVYVSGGALDSGILAPTSAVRRGYRRQRWVPAVAAQGISFGAPTATVPYSSSIGGSFVANIPGLLDGQTYEVVVRAYNASGEDPNDVIVLVTADATGPAPVSMFTVTAIA